MNFKNASSKQLLLVETALRNGDSKPLESMIDLFKEEGSPLIEPAINEGNSIITFIYQGDSSTENVTVFFCTAPDEDGLENSMMRKLHDTNIWFKSFEMPSKLRTTYLFSVNDLLIPFTSYSDVIEKIDDYITDPFNKKTYTLRSSPEEFRVSVLELPDAPKQPWNIPRRGVEKGKTKMYQYRSDVLETDHYISVYTPPNYDENGKPCNVLLLFDGWSYYNFAEITTVFDNLSHVNRIPPYVVVMHTNENQNIRDFELPCNQSFQKFLTLELMPWVHKKFNISDSPEETVVAGSCFGGIAAAYAALKAPQRFGKVISQSGSFWWPGKGQDIAEDFLIGNYEQSVKLSIQFSIEIGSLETASLDYDPITAHRKFRDTLLNKGYKVDYEEYIGGHDMVCWRGTFINRLLSFHPKK
ncbi:DUF3327 domain-containing protein [Listeria welshimeri]|uniref:alpha/beta hydrolase-fold protein n=1 Tax=Listeria welshimeri TaxID=1643 RepID=UPI001888C225|nr:alpha/beta hydrolase-fold protein [Listeria welshimeri]MBF2464334.1 DUF3327 domain-containing protein [Listeria welshimeri]